MTVVHCPKVRLPTLGAPCVWFVVLWLETVIRELACLSLVSVVIELLWKLTSNLGSELVPNAGRLLRLSAED